jgi:hypothetical protein
MVTLPLSSAEFEVPWRCIFTGSAINQAVSRWLPNAAAHVRSHISSCGICGEQCVTGTDFLRVLVFPLPILIDNAILIDYLWLV